MGIEREVGQYKHGEDVSLKKEKVFSGLAGQWIRRPHFTEKNDCGFMRIQGVKCIKAMYNK